MTIVAAYAVPHPPLIVPAVGRGEERAIQATIDAYDEVARRVALHDPDAIVITSPHAPLYRDGFFVSDAEGSRGDMGDFHAPEAALELPCDVVLAEQVSAISQELFQLPVIGGRAPIETMDHATFVPLYFITKRLERPPIVRIGLSGLGPRAHQDLGCAIYEAANFLARRVVLIASGDLSHKLKPEGPYGFDPAGPLFDDAIADIFRTGRLDDLFALDPRLCDAAAECGLRSFWIMAGALNEQGEFRSELLSYEGPFGVGYGVAAFEGLDDPHQFSGIETRRLEEAAPETAKLPEGSE